MTLGDDQDQDKRTGRRDFPTWARGVILRAGSFTLVLGKRPAQDAPHPTKMGISSMYKANESGFQCTKKGPKASASEPDVSSYKTGIKQQWQKPLGAEPSYYHYLPQAYAAKRQHQEGSVRSNKPQSSAWPHKTQHLPACFLEQPWRLAPF